MASKQDIHRSLEHLSAEDGDILRENVKARSIDEMVGKQLDLHARIMAGATRGLQFRRGIGRRAMLKGLGASALLAPFLPSLLRPGRARAQTEQYDNLLIIDWPCGMEPGWTPVGTGASYEVSDQGPGGGMYATEPQMKTLVEKHRDKILILSGMEGLIATDLYSHSQGPASMWTGFTGAAATKGLSGLPSIEQKIRDKIGANTPVKSIHAGTMAMFRQQGPSTIALPFFHWSAPQTGIEPIDDPGILYMDLASSLATASPAAAMASAPAGADPGAMRDLMMRQQKSVIDFVMGEISSAKTRISVEDATRLDEHLTQVRDLEQRLFVGGGASSGGSSVSCDGATAPDMALTGMGSRTPTNGPALVKAQAEIIALAMKCGLTKVATLQLAESDCQYTVPYEGSTAALHLASHNMGNSNDVVTRWVSTRYMMDMVAQIIDIFAATQVGEGQTLLDKTLIVATSEMSIQEHLDTNLPYVICGGSTGYFKKGEHLALSTNYRISKVVLNVLEYFGYDDQTLGTSAMAGGDTDGVLMEVKA
jgi:hypothetical protein